jgi:hypothetical protein
MNSWLDLCDLGAARAIGIPTLGETGMKFRSSRWTQCGAEEGLSVFDVRGAMEAIEKVRLKRYVSLKGPQNSDWKSYEFSLSCSCPFPLAHKAHC